MILLTGATGFLGSRLLAGLLSKGHEVVALKRKTSSTAKIAESLSHPALRLFDINAVDPAQIFERFAVDTIIHIANEYGRGSTPLYSILDANLLLPVRLAELGIRGGVQCFINSDSFFNEHSNSYSNLLNYSLSKKSLLIWLDKLSSDQSLVSHDEAAMLLEDATARTLASHRHSSAAEAVAP